MQKRHLVDINGDSIDSSVPLAVREYSIVSTDNSTEETLNAGIAFTGEWEDILQYSVLIVTLKSNVASATDGLCVDFSHNAVDVINTDVYTIPAGVGKTFSFQPAARYFRITYTNGGTNQTTFALQSQLKSDYVKPSSHRVQDAIVNEDDAELVKAVLTGVDDDGIFQNVKTTVNGDIKINDTTSGLSIAEGNATGKEFIHKFGKAPDFDITDGDVTVWDGANDASIDAMQYTYSATADIDSLVSSNNGDTQDIEIIGLDTNYNEITQTVTLTGQTRAVLGTTLIRVFRLTNRGITDIAGIVSCYVNSAITLGVVDDKTKVRAIINDGNNQTLMATYTVPSGKKAYMRDWFASLTSKKTSFAEIKLVARPFGEVFQVKHVSDINSDGTSYIQHKYEEPEVFLAKTDIELRASTSVDANGVSGGFDIVLIND